MAQLDSGSKMKLPGYDERLKKDAAESLRRRRLEKEAEDKSRQEKLKLAAEKLQQDKKKAIKKELPYVFNEKLLGGIHAIIAAAKIQLITFAAGSAIFGINAMIDEDKWDNMDPYTVMAQAWFKAPYGDMSYGQAVKNAYLFDDFLHGRGGVFQAIVGLITMLIALGVGIKGFEKGQAIAEKNNSYANLVYRNLEQLKEYGVDVDALYLGLNEYSSKLISRMSEMDRGYLKNLLNDGLEKANWDVANAIVTGHLKSHPEDYNEIIKVIDESTMDPELVKKYGKGGIMSFGAARAMARNKSRD